MVCRSAMGPGQRTTFIFSASNEPYTGLPLSGAAPGKAEYALAAVLARHTLDVSPGRFRMACGLLRARSRPDHRVGVRHVSADVAEDHPCPRSAGRRYRAARDRRSLA